MQYMVKEYIKNACARAVNLVFPMVCPLCGRIIPLKRQAFSSHETNPYICPECYMKLAFPEDPFCLKCSRPIQEEVKEYCPDCERAIRYFDQGKALLMHDERAKKILYDLKYHNRKDNAKMLAREAADRLFGIVKHWNPDVVIPVPLHKKRELKRGFNQAALLTEHLIRELKDYGLNLNADPNYLVRVRTTSAQKELRREQRSENIRGAFEISYKEDPGKYTGSTVLLVDDIYTSGATLSECARILKEAGVSKVYFLTFSIG